MLYGASDQCSFSRVPKSVDTSDGGDGTDRLAFADRSGEWLGAVLML
jgi:hypothetical protein